MSSPSGRAEGITETLLKEFNYGTGPGAAQIAPMMRELK